MVNIEIDSQLVSRSLIIVPDESKTQTEAIQRQQAHFDAYPWEQDEYAKELKAVIKVIRYLRDSGVKKVVVPYSDLILLPADEIQTRRDRPKIISLIRSLAFLRQMNRSIFEKNGEKYVVAEWEDCLDVLESCGGVITQTVTKLSENEMIMIEKLQSEFGAMSFTADRAKQIFNQSLSTVRQKLSGLRNKGVVSVVEGGGRGRRNQYTLNVIDTNPALLSELKSIEKSVVEEKVKTWKKNLGDVTWLHFNERGKLAHLE